MPKDDHIPPKPNPYTGWFQSSTDRKLDYLVAAVAFLIRKVCEMAVDLSDLQATVDATKAGEDSAIALMNGLAAKIDQLIASSGNTVDPAALQALSDSLKASTANLAAAVVADARP